MAYEFLLPLVNGWLGKIAEAKAARRQFDDEAEQCVSFFGDACGFMWSDKFKSKFLGGKVNPTFKITIQKAFELVALYAPVLCWKHPGRVMKPRKLLDIPPDVFGPTAQEEMQEQMQAMQEQLQGLPPEMAQQVTQRIQQQFSQPSQGDLLRQMYAKEQKDVLAKSKTRSLLLEAWLNYTPTEMPGGGLAKHMQMGCTEALVKGRSCLWPEKYSLPGSERILTGCFYDTVDNLLIDPDATSLFDAKWIARKCTHPIWQVAREYKIPESDLKGRGARETAGGRGERMGGDRNNMKRAQGKTFDSITYWKIWSKGGCGARLTGMDTGLKDAFDKVVGDYAYLVVAEGCQYPLNIKPSMLLDPELGDEAVAEAFDWPVPYWKDDKWPVACLDFYPRLGKYGVPASAWPRAPMAPGLGELTYINMFMSHLAGRVWSSSRDFIAVLESASQYVEPALTSGADLAIIKLPEIHKAIDEVLKFVQQPQVNKDAFIMIDRMTQSFERRVGLNELLYGLNPGGTQSRTATDTEAKKDYLSVRPDYMAGCVEEWMTEASDLEKICTRWHVEAPDVVDLVGNTGARLWQEFITDEDPELVFRETRCTIQAGSAKKPNRQKDSQNLQAAMPILVPELSKHADVTGDTGPINALVVHYGEAAELDVSDYRMGPRVPQPPPPEQAQAMQQMQQLEAGKLQAETQKISAEAQAVQAEAGGKGQEAQVKMQEAQMKLQFDQADAAAKMQADREKNQADLQMKGIELVFDQQRNQMEMAHDQAKFQQEMQQGEQNHLVELLNQRQQLQMQREQGEQDLRLNKQQGQQKISDAKQMGKIKAKQAAKPSVNGAKK